MTYYATADKEFGIGEYRTVTEARKEAVKFLKKYPKGYSMVWIYDGRKADGVVNSSVFGKTDFQYQKFDLKGKTYTIYDLYADGTLGRRQ